MIDKALQYVEQGFLVLPLQVKGKAPMTTKNFPNGFKSATNDFGKIVEHWNAFPQSNVGIEISDSMLVLDIDVHEEDGFQSLKTLVDHFGTLPVTFTVNTATGGRHYYFKLPEGVTIDRQINAFKGIDVLTNGYVVAPPSVVESGKYELLCGSLDHLAVCPEWLLKAFEVSPTSSNSDCTVKESALQRKTGKKYTGALLDELVNGATVGGRNDWIMRMTSKMLAVGAELDTIYRLLIVVNDNFLSEPLPLSEINATFKSRVKKHTSGV